MGFNSAFKGLSDNETSPNLLLTVTFCSRLQGSDTEYTYICCVHISIQFIQITNFYIHVHGIAVPKQPIKDQIADHLSYSDSY